MILEYGKLNIDTNLVWHASTQHASKFRCITYTEMYSMIEASFLFTFYFFDGVGENHAIIF